jgi:ribonuclease VapC
VLTTVNATEVIGTLMTAGFRAEQARAALDAVGCRIVPFEKPAAILAGELRPLTRHLGLSLGDRACLATARQFGLPAATADRDWAKLEIGIEVWVIR